MPARGEGVSNSNGAERARGVVGRSRVATAARGPGHSDERAERPRSRDRVAVPAVTSAAPAAPVEVVG
ncbi:hypothetical protein scyTo_0009325 [Scyliorhinus torazame]|uniref:Uncharacterized protein n=1 Tax=Scyliorhinus torazame TaxID=75743 RepID=A0A401NKH2_SCYTO|nr:hypothetical protein [Scyliorhinus torazame]